MEQNIWIAGVDEAGRGPLAGPVVAAAVILDPAQPIDGLADSKKLSEKKRFQLEQLIMARSAAYAIAFIEHDEIDAINILQASLKAMRVAVAQLTKQPQIVLVDGNKAPAIDHDCEVRTIIGGDRLEPAISAASILAKQARDRIMVQYDAKYPNYGFAGHKGYPTKAHRQALEQLGPCPIHRHSFGPVRRVIMTTQVQESESF